MRACGSCAAGGGGAGPPLELPPEDGGPLHARRKAAPQREDILVVPEISASDAEF